MKTSLKNLVQRLHRLREGVRASLHAIFRPGESKHEARAQYNQEVRDKAKKDGKTEEEIRKLPLYPSPYIHSYSTYRQYLYLCEQYVAWLAAEHPDVNKLDYAFRMGYSKEYIQKMIDRGLAASTVARTTSALAKLYRCSACDIHDDRPERCYQDFTRSRLYNQKQYEKDVDKYGMVAELCRMTGLREIELEHLYPECFIEDTDGKMYLHLDGKRQHTKGGKSRDVVILYQYQQRLREILSGCEAGKLICPKAPSHLDIHGIRAMYAIDYYNEIARSIEDIPTNERVPLKHFKKDNSRPNQVRTTAPGVYTRRADGKKFDRAAMLVVSQSLGHSRVDVMAHSYLR